VRFGFDYEDAPITHGIGGVRVRTVPASPIPVSQFKIEIVDNLSVTLPDNRTA
jgi:hypothetical protein